MGDYRYTRRDLSDVEELAHRAALSIENARFYEEAQQAIRARDDFLLVASHELKTPLTSLQLQLDNLLWLSKKPSTEASRFAPKIETAGRLASRLAALIEGLLDVSRLTTGRLKLERERFDLGASVSDLVARFSQEALRAGCDLTVQVDAVIGEWDRLRIEQLITNLISNGLKYGAGKPIEVTVRQHAGAAFLTVADHGIGIPPEKVPFIFGKFERAVPVRHYGGLGLGLFIARQIVDSHGGTIRVTSEPGKGSTFTVELPLRPAAATEQELPAEASP
jgi:signal transduction histidine kinase